MSSTSTASETGWQSDYRRKTCTAEEAVKGVRSGDNIYIHSNAAAPQILTDALVSRAPELRDVKIHHLLTLGKAEYAKPEYSASFKVNALFIGSNVRSAVNEGRADYTPVFLSEISQLITEGILPVDVCFLQVSPPDQHGYCSLGVSVDCTMAARKRARLVIAEVNQQMPRTFGRSFVHVSRIDKIVETDHSLPDLPASPVNDKEMAIGKFVASLVEDGATIQLGIGNIPNAVLHHLRSKTNLGVHTEMFSDGIVELVQAGVITNDLKTLLPGKIAVSFVMGTKTTYDFVDRNPSVEFQTSDFINDPFTISSNYRMTSINSAIQVDLSGQVCSDSIGTNLFSGFGGQVDFVRGSVRSKGGKSIIVLPSTAKNDSLSRIVALLDRGAGVVTSRGDVHYVVTEYGIANLYGRTLRERARELLAISHPKFQDELEREFHKFYKFAVS